MGGWFQASAGRERWVGGWVAQEARARERMSRGTWCEKKRNAELATLKKNSCRAI